MRGTIFKVETGKDHASVIEATGPALIDANLALLALVVPYTSSLVTCTRYEGAVCRVEVDLGDHITVSYEGAKNVVVVQGPVHNSLMIITFTRRQDALVMMSELDEVDAVSLAIVGIDFLTSLKIIQTDRKVLAARHQVLSVMTNVH